MKLTNTIRDAFIRSAMNDVPSVDYVEQARSLIFADSINQLPPKVLAIAKDKDLSHFVETCNYHAGNLGFPTVCVGRGERFAPSSEVAVKLEAMRIANEEQTKARRELNAKIKAVAYSVTTRKALATMLPEFEKYLPADEQAAIKTLPAVANIVADFTKAGWPKTKKPTARSAA